VILHVLEGAGIIAVLLFTAFVAIMRLGRRRNVTLYTRPGPDEDNASKDKE
jgi:hypothetical protein